VGTVGTTAVDPTEPTIGDTPSVGTAAAELTPRFPISVDPNGSPVRAAPPTVVGEVVVGDEDAVMLLEPEPHIPDMPEVCSISEVLDTPDVAEIADEVESPGEVDIPDAAAVAGAAVPTPIPPPSKLAVDPNMDDGAVPMVEHVVALLVLGMEIVPVASPGAGLTPGDTISVEPSGIPVGETDDPVPKPSGEVAPRVGVGTAIPLTCAIAALQTKSAARTAAIGDNLTGKRARIKLLRRIGPQDCRVYMLRPFQMPSDGLRVESARPLAVRQLNTSLLLRRPDAPGADETAAVSNFGKLNIILFEQASFAPDLHQCLRRKNVGPISQ
jgi:hypothetical protein